ncbi:MAG: insulinase family protein [Paludibacteraceae bacterium]|nr:insulinase family protein [Paludibacteraceae bacterium]
MIAEDAIFYYTLPNGIRVVHIQNDSPVAYCGMGIHIGTRNEEPEESGMAHFIEHCMFKGTTHRNAWHILNRLEDVGGDINAYTEKEETFVYATVLDEYYERAMELVTDLVFYPTFPQNELDKEKDVIIDEINAYNDSPSELIYDDFEGLLFNGCPLGRSVLGEETILEKYTTADAMRFHQRCYGTDRLIFFSMGRMPLKKLQALDDKYLRIIPKRDSQLKLGFLSEYKVQHVVADKDLHQVNYIAGTRAYGISDERRFPLVLLNNILGGPGQNSRLNVAIRERGGMSYSVESGYTAYSDTGILSVYFSTDHKHKDKCIGLLMNELRRLREEKLSSAQLHRAQMQLKGQIAIAEENNESVALGIAKNFLYFGEYSPLEARIARIDQITAEQLQEVANDLLTEDKLSTLLFK